jgi:hypothetical protein
VQQAGWSHWPAGAATGRCCWSSSSSSVDLFFTTGRSRCSQRDRRSRLQRASVEGRTAAAQAAGPTGASISVWFRPPAEARTRRRAPSGSAAPWRPNTPVGPSSFEPTPLCHPPAAICPPRFAAQIASALGPIDAIRDDAAGQSRCRRHRGRAARPAMAHRSGPHATEDAHCNAGRRGPQLAMAPPPLPMAWQ